MITASEMEGVSQRPMIDSVVKNLLGEWRRTDAHRPKFRLRQVVIGHGRILTGSELSTLSRAWHEEIRAHHCGEDSGIGLLQQRFGYSGKFTYNYCIRAERKWGGVTSGIEVVCVALRGFWSLELL